MKVKNTKRHIYYTYYPNRDVFRISSSVLRQMMETVAENARDSERAKKEE